MHARLARAMALAILQLSSIAAADVQRIEVDARVDVLGGRTTDEDHSGVLSSLKRPHLDYFKMFYADTAMFGTHIGIECGLQFFGIDHAVFSTDCPFAPVKETFDSIDRLGLTEADRKKLFGGNAARLMKLEID